MAKRRIYKNPDENVKNKKDELINPKREKKTNK